jgi:hypothetical protein
VKGIPPSLLALDVGSILNHAVGVQECVAAIAEHAHDPPAFCSPFLALRI